MKDLTSFGGGQKRPRVTDAERTLREKIKSQEWRKNMKPIEKQPGYGNPAPEQENEINQ